MVVQASELYCKYLGDLCLSMEMSYSPAGTVSFISFSETEGHRLAGYSRMKQPTGWIINFHIRDTDHAGTATQLNEGGLFFCLHLSASLKVRQWHWGYTAVYTRRKLYRDASGWHQLIDKCFTLRSGLASWLNRSPFVGHLHILIWINPNVHTTVKGNLCSCFGWFGASMKGHWRKCRTWFSWCKR